MNSRVSKAIRGERKEGLKRSADNIPDVSVRKLIKTDGEARGEIAREVVTRRDVFDPKGAMVDAIDYVEWEETKEEIRELKMPVIMVDNGSRRRGIQACEIQHMLGGYYVWETEKSTKLDVMTLDKIKRAGGTLTTVDDQRVWTNSPVLRRRILQEQERRDWTAKKGIKTCREISWGRLFSEALREQVERRESDCNFMERCNQDERPRRCYYGED